MHKVGSAVEEAARAKYDAAFALLEKQKAVHHWLVVTACATTDGTERAVIDALATRCEAEVNSARMAWLTARRAWGDVLGLDLEPIDGI
ncbi:hypothetical protein [Parafrankia sp. FMc2]|uniref:hypothetical protein n=1 Tax=Parafrankia sp. FMc2 TaxID=3233196 RepID=UPI0034D4EF75